MYNTQRVTKFKRLRREVPDIKLQLIVLTVTKCNFPIHDPIRMYRLPKDPVDIGLVGRGQIADSKLGLLY